jgi:ribokinase
MAAGREAGQQVVAVGSLHLDLVLSMAHLPVAGETVLGSGHFRNPGGKGGNQAVAAARLGSDVAMVGQVGDDDDGRRLLAALREAGVDTSGVAVHPELPSGLAVVAVDDEGENQIIVSPGASGALPPAQVEAAGDLIARAAVVLLSLEVDMAAVEAAARLATGTVVLNPAPARALPQDLLDRVDVLVPNRGELAALAGAEAPSTPDEVAALAATLVGPKAVVVSLGGDGALLVQDGHTRHVPAPKVDVVDTTGAGDTLCGALADALARGLPLEAALADAVTAASLSTTRAGAQQSAPTRAEVAAANA